MIICHKYKFIFIKTAKTASTSLEIALSKFCNENDILTPLIEEDELLRSEMGYQSSCNYKLKLSQWKKREFYEFIKTFKRPQYGGHCSAKFVKSRLSPKIWNKYYKFCFDINPWDKAISLYYWQTRNNPKRPEFSQYFKSLKKNKLSNFNKYTINGKVIVDDVFKYEKLHQSIDFISNKLNIPIKDYLVKTKNTFREKDSKQKTLLTEDHIDTIGNLCRREIELLKYKYED